MDEITKNKPEVKVCSPNDHMANERTFLVFEEGKTDLTPADETAIRELARSIPTPAASSVNVVAYAAGKPDDPSTARRVSLSRGIAVRSVLLASGVPSAQIYVRAMGAAASDGPADRVELTVARIGTVTR